MVTGGFRRRTRRLLRGCVGSGSGTTTRLWEQVRQALLEVQVADFDPGVSATLSPGWPRGGGIA